jgi:Rieske Fe-S protein
VNETPLWKRDFPYTSSGEEGVTRRDFTRFLMGASVAAAGGGGLMALWASLRSINTGEPAPIVPLDRVPVAGSYLFDYPTPNDPAILLRLGEESVIAFSQKCTHLGCVVYWAPEEERLLCPCHEGVFNLEGRPVAGPPDRPLGRIDVEVRGGTVWALGVGEGLE